MSANESAIGGAICYLTTYVIFSLLTVRAFLLRLNYKKRVRIVRARPSYGGETE